MIHDLIDANDAAYISSREFVVREGDAKRAEKIPATVHFIAFFVFEPDLAASGGQDSS
jgi:hypothetical protein